MRRELGRWVAILGLVAVGACKDGGDGDDELPPPVGDPPYETLSDWRFFEGDLADLQPAEGVFGYQVASPLWSDHARKGRFFRLPEGGKITLTDQDEWGFPKDTIFIKTFFFDQDRRGGGSDPRIVETRLLVHEDDGWASYIYLWNDEQTEATRLKGGADVQLDYVDEDGKPQTQLYLVPDQNTCEDCHLRDDVALVLGPTTMQMNMPVAVDDAGGVNQIDLFAQLGLFDAPPPAGAELPAFAMPDGDAPLEERARAYLHGNCAHCHRPGGGGGASGLSFLYWEDRPAKFGVCKVPAAAGPGAGGRSVDIWPGDPDRSIIPYRMTTTDPEIKMPELPSLLADDFGAQLVSDWIASLTLPACE